MNLLFIFSETNQSDTWSIKWVIYIIRAALSAISKILSLFVCFSLLLKILLVFFRNYFFFEI